MRVYPLLRRIMCALVGATVLGCGRSLRANGPAGIGPDTPRTHVDDYVEQVSQVVGLPPLRSLHLAKGTREIRIMAVPSGMVWDMTPMLRLVETRDSVYGQLFQFWTQAPEGIANDDRYFSGCKSRSTIRRTGVCDIPSWHMSWPRIADSLARLGAWDAVQGSGRDLRNTNVSDHDGLIVEVRDGRGYRSVGYYGVYLFEGPAARALERARALVVYLVAIW